MPKKYYVFEYSDIDRALAAGNKGDIIRYEPENQSGIAVYEIEISNGQKFKTEIGDMNGFDEDHESYNTIDYTVGELPSESPKRKRVNSTRSSSSRSHSRSPKKHKASGGRKSRRAKKSKKARGRKTKRRY